LSDDSFSACYGRGVPFDDAKDTRSRPTNANAGNPTTVSAVTLSDDAVAVRAVAKSNDTCGLYERVSGARRGVRRRR